MFMRSRLAFDSCLRVFRLFPNHDLPLRVDYSSLDFVGVFSKAGHHHLSAVYGVIFYLPNFLFEVLKYSEARVRVFVVDGSFKSLLSNQLALLFHIVLFRQLLIIWLLIILLYNLINVAFILLFLFLFCFFG